MNTSVPANEPHYAMKKSTPNQCVLWVMLGFVIFLFASCKGKSGDATDTTEGKEAKKSLQGIWVDGDTGDVTFKIDGDSILYPDSTSQSAPFKIMGDTLVIGSNGKYPIVKRSSQVLWFENPNGDVVKLNKSNDPDDALVFTRENKRAVTTTAEVVKKDTVVMYAGERYHCYIVTNPTRYKVVNTTYNSDGVAIDKVYYDNIMHISIYKGSEKLYSRDINKRMFSRFVPKQILSQSILTCMEFTKVDSRGFHFNTTICIPDDASCYMLDTYVSLKGQLAMELIEY